jgi:hypothetical protein
MKQDDSALQQRHARRVLLLIAGIPVVMMLAATALWWTVEAGYLNVVDRFGTANHGALVTPPRSVSEIVFRHEGAAEVLWGDLPVKWRVVMVQRGNTCDTVCQNQLYQTRQIHAALGKDFNRIGRVLLGDAPLGGVVLADSDPAQSEQRMLAGWLAREHQGLTSLTLPAAILDELVPEASASPTQWYVVDPAGWIMMRMSDDLHYKDVISDLRFLLKHSGA